MKFPSFSPLKLEANNCKICIKESDFTNTYGQSPYLRLKFEIESDFFETCTFSISLQDSYGENIWESDSEVSIKQPLIDKLEELFGAQFRKMCNESVAQNSVNEYKHLLDESADIEKRLQKLRRTEEIQTYLQKQQHLEEQELANLNVFHEDATENETDDEFF